jgi:hypothetical protein
LPAEYGLLQTRNPFAHGKHAPGPGEPGVPPSPESGFVLKGVMDAEGTYTAFVEETGSKRVLQLSTGQPVARGHVKSVTLDGIEYEAPGIGSKRIAVGQNLNGQQPPPAAPPPQPAGPPPPPGGPPQPSPEPPSGARRGGVRVAPGQVRVIQN